MNKAVRLAVVVLAVLVFGGCSRTGTAPTQAPAPASETPTLAFEHRAFWLEGDGCAEFDRIIRRMGGREIAKMIATTIDTLSKEDPRPLKSSEGVIFDGKGNVYVGSIEIVSGRTGTRRAAKVEATFEGFQAAGSVTSGEKNCWIAVFLDKWDTDVECDSDGSNGKIVSSLTLAVVKVFDDLTLPDSGVVVPAGTVLRRDSEEWVKIKDPEASRRLDALKSSAESESTG